MIKRVIASSCLALVTTGNLQSAEEEKVKSRVLKELEQLLIRPEKVNQGKTVSAEPAYMKTLPAEEGKSTLIYRCRHTKARNLVDILESIVSTTGTVEESSEKNMIVINDTNKKVEEVKRMLPSLDIYVPQILVEAKVVEVFIDESNEHEFEFDINNTGAKQEDQLNFFPFTTTGINGSYNRFYAFLRWLKTARDAKILSSPNLTVGLGATASIITGEDLPIPSTQSVSGTISTSIDYKRIGVKLNVTPELINKDMAKIRVNPEVSTVVREVEIEQAGGQTSKTPVISVRNINTELTVKNGELIMLGGLYSSKEKTTVKKVPYLGDIPYLGWFFRSESESTELTQLIFFLKITILEEGEVNGTSLIDIGKQARELHKIGDTVKKSDEIFGTKIKRDAEKASE